MLLTDFTHYSSVSIADFEQVNAHWEKKSVIWKLVQSKSQRPQHDVDVLLVFLLLALTFFLPIFAFIPLQTFSCSTSTIETVEVKYVQI